MQKTPEQILAEELAKGDRQAMKDLYGLYSGYLYTICSRYITDRDAVRDVLQDSFVKIFSSVGKFRYRGEGSLKAWMGKIVVNQSLKYLQKAVKTDFIVHPEVLPDIPEDSNESPVLANIPQPVIYDMIRRLPDGYRTIFNLYVFEDKSHKEIASMLGIKENSSASQLHRAKAMLAKWINEYREKTGASQ